MKLGLLSREKLNLGAHWTTLEPPLLNSLASYKDSLLVAPPSLQRRNLRQWGNVAKAVRSVDTMFWVQGRSRPEGPVLAASILAGVARRSAFVIDPWKDLIFKIGTLAVLQRLDPCFISSREAYEELKRRFVLGRFEWLPFGVDTDVFDCVPGERPIFVLDGPPLRIFASGYNSVLCKRRPAIQIHSAGT